MRADIADIGAADGEELAVLVERELGLDRQIAALIIADEGFGAVAEPFHRPAELLRRPGQQRIFREEEIPRAEIAAHIAAHRADILGRHAERAGEIAALARDAAAGAGIERVEIVLVDRIADRIARLHRRAGDTIAPAFEVHDMRGLGESRVGRRLVADIDIDDEIGRRLVPHLRRARLHRVGGAHDRRQHLVIDLDQLGAVLRLIDASRR